MPTELTWLGHGSWSIAAGEYTVLLDPFSTDNPSASAKADEVEADFILISHGHSDHVGDAVAIARRTGAVVIANYEICLWFSAQGVENIHAMNIGDNYTMGPDDALEAVKLLNPKLVAPVHFGTWPLVAQDADAWAGTLESRKETA